MRHQPGNHCLRASLRKRLVRRGVSLIVRVAFDAQLQFGILLQKLYNFAQCVLRIRLDSELPVSK